MKETLTAFLGTGIWAIIKAVVLLLLAFLAAKIVKSLIIKLFTKTKLNALLGKSDAAQASREKTIEFICCHCFSAALLKSGSGPMDCLF